MDCEKYIKSNPFTVHSGKDATIYIKYKHNSITTAQRLDDKTQQKNIYSGNYKSKQYTVSYIWMQHIHNEHYCGNSLAHTHTNTMQITSTHLGMTSHSTNAEMMTQVRTGMEYQAIN